MSPLWTCTVDHRVDPQGRSTTGKISPLWTYPVDHRARPQGKSTVENPQWEISTVDVSVRSEQWGDMGLGKDVSTVDLPCGRAL